MAQKKVWTICWPLVKILITILLAEEWQWTDDANLAFQALVEALQSAAAHGQRTSMSKHYVLEGSTSQGSNTKGSQRTHSTSEKEEDLESEDDYEYIDYPPLEVEARYKESCRRAGIIMEDKLTIVPIEVKCVPPQPKPEPRVACKHPQLELEPRIAYKRPQQRQRPCQT